MIRLRFDFENQSLCFEKPLSIIQCSEVNDVPLCFNSIEIALSQGYHVAGYVSYEALSAFYPQVSYKQQSNIPLLWFGVFAKALTADDLHNTYPPSYSNWQANTDQETYHQHINTIRTQIAKGEVYQVNYTFRFNSQLATTPMAFYQQLKQAQQSQYCAYLQIDNQHIISASPELFFKREREKIKTKPMKGTRPRGLTPQQDSELKNQLANSSKDQAENLMIVDLLRNDLAKISQLGTVKVTELFNIEAYPTVWQMTSTISAKLQPHSSYFDIFKALFPCGSITGAPKIAAMQMIQQLERAPRGVYCGAIGYFSPNQEAIFNVAIRTAIFNQQTSQAQYGVGGGITYDSSDEDEYQEAYNKAQIILNPPQGLIESFLINDGLIFLLELHLDRLKTSAQELGFDFDTALIVATINQLALAYPLGKYKAKLELSKLELSKLGAINTTISPITTEIKTINACLAQNPINKHNKLYYHKTIHRDIYPPASLENEILLYNQDNEITEFVNGNFVFKIKQQWYTPPISCGLLPGTYRQQLLNQGKIKEKILTVAELNQTMEIAFINSVRGWLKVNLINN